MTLLFYLNEKTPKIQRDTTVVHDKMRCLYHLGKVEFGIKYIIQFKRIDFVYIRMSFPSSLSLSFSSLSVFRKVFKGCPIQTFKTKMIEGEEK